MEKNQHNTNSSGAGQQDNDFPNSQPGQQLPAGAEQGMETRTDTGDETEQHSESSFPQQDNETLGTP